ncbi:hypothetical protein [Vitiosangium sp. GDMCC 1.1324]|uniref:hypothetical protein n=1 Tax=Vitiosangium sp. (strain GDMCC 1.1324) TaxID=2138576 RepID=UPI000D36397D|nr:hypothetical protein [Vitiosangium sp. GDMCC 1.1324]PTL79489.1 hypothetical protein DAT35_32250 [Vitiosangium sp. GDMCC 1.1324]
MLKNSRFGKLSFAVLAAGALLVGCGGTEEMQGPAQPEAQQAPRGEVRAQSACNLDTDCVVLSSSVTCRDGFIMYAYSSDDGWCIKRDVCARHGGPVVCPF